MRTNLPGAAKVASWKNYSMLENSRPAMVRKITCLHYCNFKKNIYNFITLKPSIAKIICMCLKENKSIFNFSPFVGSMWVIPYKSMEKNVTTFFLDF